MNATQEYYENDYALFWIEGHVLYFEYKPDTVITLAVAKKVVSDRIRFQNEKTYPVFCDVRGIIDSDKSGRDYLAQSGSILTKAVAILGHQNVSQTMSSFYLKINKPSVPTAFFTNKQSALAFLEAYK